jgi:hypothetical protein
MAALAALLGAVAALAAGSTGRPGADPLLAPRVDAARLGVRMSLDAGAPALALGDGAGAPERAGAPCLPELCPPRVEVPGLSAPAVRPSRTELFAALLDRAGVEPFATIAWLFVATGLRIDWSPPLASAGDPAAARGGWGSVSVRLRLRVDATNRPALPARHDRRPHRTWAALEVRGG